jgi:acetylornithine deacetylase
MTSVDRDLVQLLEELVAIDSVNPDLSPDGAGEGLIARVVGEWLERLGVEVTFQETAPGRPNVIGRVRGKGSGRALMLKAHMDTVSTTGMHEALVPRIADGRLYGRGAYDMKGSLAAIMLVAAEVAARPAAGDVLITAVSDEEYASLGIAAVVRAYNGDAAIVTEPTDMTVTVAHKGFAWFDIETTGIAAHGSLPDEGVDAIVKIGPVLTEIGELDRRLRGVARHPLLHSGSIHASLIEGGIELSTYPDHCRVSIKRRTVPGETPEIIEQELQAILDSTAKNDSTFSASLSRGLVRDPFEVSEQEPIVQAIMQQATATLGRRPNTTGAGGWMDSALLSAGGIPTVIFGPTGDGAHAAEEWVDLASLDQCRQICLDVVREFCA